MSTLKEKFNSLVPKEFGGMQEPTLTRCEQIADDYAIEFARWCFNVVSNNKYKGIDTTKELLEIFKKENGYV